MCPAPREIIGMCTPGAISTVGTAATAATKAACITRMLRRPGVPCVIVQVRAVLARATLECIKRTVPTAGCFYFYFYLYLILVLLRFNVQVVCIRVVLVRAQTRF